MTDDTAYPRPVHVLAFGRNKIGKTDAGALEGAGETGVLTSAQTLELPITQPPVEVDQMIKLDGDLAAVIAVRRIEGNRQEATFRRLPNATKYLDKLDK